MADKNHTQKEIVKQGEIGTKLVDFGKLKRIIQSFSLTKSKDTPHGVAGTRAENKDSSIRKG